MRTSTRTALSTALAIAVALPVIAAEQTFERALQVTGPVTLGVSTGSGDITVRTGDDRSVKVVGTVRSTPSSDHSTQDAEAAVRAVVDAPPIVQSGNTIEIGKLADDDKRRNVSISYDVTVPRATTLSARSGSGDISVADLSAGVNARSGSGDIKIGRIEGPVSAKAGSGDVVVAAARGQTELATGSGDVSVDEAAGAVNVKTGSGDVRVRQSAPGALDASSGSGDIVAHGAAGPLHVRSASGEVTISGKPSADWDVSTASASVVIDIPDGTGFKVSASTTSGSIKNEHGGATTSAGKSYEGTVGAGGPVVHVKTVSGSVVIRKGSGTR
jgi:hypothetical protein